MAFFKSFVLNIFLTICFALSAYAHTAYFGPEFNFTSEKLTKAGRAMGTNIIGTNVNKAAQERFMLTALKRCEGCTVEETLDKSNYRRYAIQHPSGVKFYISLDPYVVEVQMDPLSLAEIKEHRALIKKVIFDTAQIIGLRPEQGAGHIHLDLARSFGGDPLLVRNFIVDWIMHSRMAYDIFGANQTNAPTIDMNGSDLMENFIKIIDQFDKDFIKNNKVKTGKSAWLKNKWLEIRSKIAPNSLPDYVNTPENQIRSLLDSIINSVYTSSIRNKVQPDKFQNLNLSHEETMELRSVHEVQNIEEYIYLAEMLQGRIEYLKQFKKPIPFTGIKIPKSKNEAIDMFYKYSAEAGLDWDKAKTMLIREYKGVRFSPEIAEEIQLRVRQNKSAAGMSCPVLFN